MDIETDNFEKLFSCSGLPRLLLYKEKNTLRIKQTYYVAPAYKLIVFLNIRLHLITYLDGVPVESVRILDHVIVHQSRLI